MTIYLEAIFRIASAADVHIKGLGLSLLTAIYSLMALINSGKLRNTLRRIGLSVK